jgi:hypothetical protein
MVHLAGEWTETQLVRHRLVGHRHREIGATVVGVIEHGHPGASGVFARDLDGVLDGLRTGVEEYRLLREVAGGMFGEQLCDPHVTLIGRDGEHDVRELAQLCRRRRYHGVVGVSDRHDADAGTEVDELVAVDVHDNRTVRTLDEHGQGRGDPDGHDRESSLLERQRFRARNGREDTTFLGDPGCVRRGCEGVCHDLPSLSRRRYCPQGVASEV